MKSPGRPRTSSPVAVQTRLSRWLDANWDRLGLTNEEEAAIFGFRAPNTVSMWRTGRSPVPLARLPKLAEMLVADPIQLLVLWFDQQETRDPDFPPGFASLTRRRMMTANEQPLLDAVRTATKNGNPEWSKDRIAAVVRALGI